MEALGWIHNSVCERKHLTITAGLKSKDSVCQGHRTQSVEAFYGYTQLSDTTVPGLRLKTQGVKAIMPMVSTHWRCDGPRRSLSIAHYDATVQSSNVRCQRLLSQLVLYFDSMTLHM